MIKTKSKTLSNLNLESDHPTRQITIRIKNVEKQRSWYLSVLSGLKPIKKLEALDYAVVLSSVLYLLDSLKVNSKTGQVSTCFVFFYINGLVISRRAGWIGMINFTLYSCLNITSDILFIIDDLKYILKLVADLIKIACYCLLINKRVKHYTHSQHYKPEVSIFKGIKQSGYYVFYRYPIFRHHVFSSWIQSVAWFLPYIILTVSLDVNTISFFATGAFYKMVFDTYFSLTRNVPIMLSICAGLTANGLSAWKSVYYLNGQTSNNFPLYDLINLLLVHIVQFMICLREIYPVMYSLDKKGTEFEDENPKPEATVENSQVEEDLDQNIENQMVRIPSESLLNRMRQRSKSMVELTSIPESRLRQNSAGSDSNLNKFAN